MRRHAVLAAVSAALLALSACGSQTEEPSPGTSTPPAATDDTGDTATESPEPSEPKPTTEEPSPTTSAEGSTAPPTTVAPSPSVGPTTDPTDAPPPGTPTAGPLPTPPEGVECSTGAFSPGALRTDRAPQPVVDTAQALFHASMACDQDTLISRAQQDGTFLSFGGGSPESLLGLPDVEGRYLAIAALLTGTTPRQNDDLTWAWPAVHVDPSDANWQEVVDAGLYSQEQVDQMRSAEGYYGWRIGIAPDGTWSFMVAGD